jgi:hypothetical protein
MKAMSSPHVNKHVFASEAKQSSKTILVDWIAARSLLERSQ